MTLHGFIGRGKEVVSVNLFTQGLVSFQGLASDTRGVIVAVQPSCPEEMLFNPVASSNVGFSVKPSSSLHPTLAM